MDQKLIKQMIGSQSTGQAVNAMRERRDTILNEIAAAEESGKQLPEQEFKALVGELFDLNVALGDAFPDADRDGVQ